VIIARLEIMSGVQVSQKSFYLRVYDYDMLSKNDPLGEIVLPLWQVDLSQPFEDWKDLGKMTAKPKPSRKKSSSSSDDEKRKSKPSAGPASLSYSLHYEQTSQTLVATVLQCRSQQ
jgi:hypothetical protein